MSGLDTQALAASGCDVGGGEFAALDLVQHGLPGDAEHFGGLVQPQPSVGDVGADLAAQGLGDADLPGSAGGELLAQAGRWLAAALAAGRLGCDDGTDPAVAVSGARLFISGARNTAAALARDLDHAQQQLAAVHGTPEEEGKEEP